MLLPDSEAMHSLGLNSWQSLSVKQGLLHPALQHLEFIYNMLGINKRSTDS